MLRKDGNSAQQNRIGTPSAASHPLFNGRGAAISEVIRALAVHWVISHIGGTEVAAANVYILINVNLPELEHYFKEILLCASS